MAVGNLLERPGAATLPEFHHPLLNAGGAEVAALAGESQKIFMAAISALHPGKAKVQVATFQIADNDLLEGRAARTCTAFRTAPRRPERRFPNALPHTGNNRGGLRIPETVNGGRSR